MAELVTMTRDSDEALVEADDAATIERLEGCGFSLPSKAPAKKATKKAASKSSDKE